MNRYILFLHDKYHSFRNITHVISILIFIVLSLSELPYLSKRYIPTEMLPIAFFLILLALH